MRATMLLTLVAVLTSHAPSEVALREGSSPQFATDSRGTIRIVFGRADTIFVSTSRDEGTTFDSAAVIGVVRGMHLGNTRGPVVASSRTRTLVAATDRSGDIHLFALDHGANTWRRLTWTLNTVAGSAPEGLGTLAADASDNFYAVWLDYREARQTQIYFARVDASARSAPENRRIYASPDGHVCECCRPSIAVHDNLVAVMFRNWLAGNRDMYVMTSRNRGATFGTAEKVGAGSWKFDACPMDGGALAIAQGGRVSAVWRRERTVFLATPSRREQEIGAGVNPMLSQHGETVHVVWMDGARIRLKTLPDGSESIVGEGRLPQVLALPNGRALVAWERAGKVYVKGS